MKRISTFIPMTVRATVVCKFVATNGNNDNRYKVTIRDFPAKYFNCSVADAVGIHCEGQPQYFAEKRIEQLDLEWRIQAAGRLPSGEYVFTV